MLHAQVKTQLKTNDPPVQGAESRAQNDPDRQQADVIKQARDFQKQGATDKALELYSNYLKSHPESDKVFAERGIILHEAGKLQQAEQDFRSALAIKPAEGRYHFLLAKTQGEQPELRAEAIEHYERALMLNRNSDYRRDALLAIGNIAASQNDFNKSSAAFNAILQSDPSDRDAHYGRLSNLILSGRSADVTGAITSAMKQTRFETSQLQELSNLLSSGPNRRTELSLLLISNAVAIEPENYLLREERGRLLLQNGRPQEAVLDLKKAVDLVDSHGARIALADAYGAMTPPKYDLALSTLAEIPAKSPYFNSAVVAQVGIWERRGDLAKAVQIGLSAVEADSTWRSANYAPVMNRLLSDSTTFTTRTENVNVGNRSVRMQLVEARTKDQSDPIFVFAPREYVTSRSASSVVGLTNSTGPNAGIVLSRDDKYLAKTIGHEISHYSKGLLEVGARINTGMTPKDALDEIFRDPKAYDEMARVKSVAEYGQITGKLALTLDSRGRATSLTLAPEFRDMLPGNPGYKQLETSRSIKMSAYSNEEAVSGLEAFLVNQNVQEYIRAFESQNGRLPNRAERKLHSDRATALFEQARFAEALPALDKAIAQTPGSSALYENRGEAKAELRNYKGAIEDYKSAIQMREALRNQVVNPDDKASLDTILGRRYYLLGVAQDLSGSSEAANNSFGRARELGFSAPRPKR